MSLNTKFLFALAAALAFILTGTILVEDAVDLPTWFLSGAKSFAGVAFGILLLAGASWILDTFARAE